MDMIKIGNTYITAECIAAASPDLHDEDMLRIFLTGGKSVYVKASMTEAEVALVDAGLIDVVGVAVPEGDVKVMQQLFSDGFGYIAKDKTDCVFAYSFPPVKHGAYWDNTANGKSERLYIGDFEWLSWEDDEPTSIADILAELGCL